MNLNGLKKRLQKLEAQTSSKFIIFKMPDGTFKKLPRKDYMPACSDAIYGIASDRAAIVSEAVSCNETSNSNMLELLQMCI